MFRSSVPTHFRTTDPDLAKAAIAHLAAAGAYSKAWDRAFAAVDGNLWGEPKLLDNLLGHFAQLVAEGCQSLSDRNTAVEHAADELFRRTLTGEPGRIVVDDKVTLTFTYTYEEALRFAAWYCNEAAPLVRIRFDASDVAFDRGDDGFGDLCDAVPLLGTGFLTELRNTAKTLPFADAVGLAQFVSDRLRARYGDKGGARFAKLVLEGENYTQMNLEKAARSALLSKVRDEVAADDEKAAEKLADAFMILA